MNTQSNIEQIKLVLKEINEDKVLQGGLKKVVIDKLSATLDVAIDTLNKYSYEQHHGFAAREAIESIAKLLQGKINK